MPTPIRSGRLLTGKMDCPASSVLNIQRDMVWKKRLDMEYASRKIILPETFAGEEAFPVQKHHLDTNHHVNNCQYIQMAMDYLPLDFKIRQMRAEYKQQARLHDTICPEKSVDGDKIVIKLNDTEAEPYAVVEFVR